MYILSLLLLTLNEHSVYEVAYFLYIIQCYDKYISMLRSLVSDSLPHHFSLSFDTLEEEYFLCIRMRFHACFKLISHPNPSNHSTATEPVSHQRDPVAYHFFDPKFVIQFMQLVRNTLGVEEFNHFRKKISYSLTLNKIFEA